MIRREAKTAKRYARALFNLCPPAELENMQGYLESFSEIWKGEAMLREVMANPAFPEEQRIAALREIANRLAPGNATLRDLLSLLLTNRRLNLIHDVETYFKQIVSECKKLLSVEITSAFELSEEEKQQMSQRIREKIPEQYAALISAKWKVNPSVIGGLVIRSGDLVFDGSLNGAIERLGKTLRM